MFLEFVWRFLVTVSLILFLNVFHISCNLPAKTHWRQKATLQSPGCTQ